MFSADDIIRTCFLCEWLISRPVTVNVLGLLLEACGIGVCVYTQSWRLDLYVITYIYDTFMGPIEKCSVGCEVDHRMV